MPHPPRQPHTWQNAQSSSSSTRRHRCGGVNRAPLRRLRFIARLSKQQLLCWLYPPRTGPRSTHRRRTVLALDSPGVMPLSSNPPDVLPAVLALHNQPAFPGPVRGGANIAPPRERPRLDLSRGSQSRERSDLDGEKTGRRIGGRAPTMSAPQALDISLCLCLASDRREVAPSGLAALAARSIPRQSLTLSGCTLLAPDVARSRGQPAWVGVHSTKVESTVTPRLRLLSQGGQIDNVPATWPSSATIITS